MVVVNSLVHLLKPPRAAAALVLGAAMAGFSQSAFFWNPSPAGGGEAQQSVNWTALANGGGARAPGAREDAFSDTTMGPWIFIDSVKDNFSSASFARNPGRLTLAARGKDVWVDANQFAAVYRTDITGDLDVTVKVESQTKGSDPWAKSGILLFNNFNNPGAGGAFGVMVTRDNGFVVQYDSTNNPLPGYPSTAPGRVDAPGGPFHPPSSFPCWLRVTRVGNSFTGYYKRNLDSAWTQIHVPFTPLNASLGVSSQVGLFVTSHNVAVACTTVFDDFHGGGDLASPALALNFGGTGAQADHNAVLGANLGAASVDFTGYSGAFSFGGWALSLTGNATFAPTMAIHPNTGRLVLAGTAGTQNLVPKPSDTLPTLWKTGGSTAQVLSHPLIADSLHIAAGTFNLGAMNAHVQQLTAAGGALGGFGADDTLFVHGRADFAGLGSLAAGSGTVAVKAVGGGKTALFNPAGLPFRNVTLWTVPIGAGVASVQVGPGALAVAGDLVFRSQRAPKFQDAETNFLTHNPDVTVGGNITQIIEGPAAPDNWYPIRMGNGAWRAGGNVAFSLRGGSADNSTLELTGAAGIQSLRVAQGSLNRVIHAAAGTVRLDTLLAADSLSLTGGALDLNGWDVSLTGNLLVDGAPGLLAGLGGRSLTVGGSAAFLGRSGAPLSLAPATEWTVKATGALTADFADIGRSRAAGALGVAGPGGMDRGGNFNWSFGGGPPTQSPAVTREPADTMVMEGSAAAFTVSASGHSPKTYRWRRTGDTAVIGRDSVLVLPAVAMGQDGALYGCEIGNSTGTAMSREAKLTVTRKPVPASIVREPVDGVAAVGESAAFSVSAAGDKPIAFAWRRRGDTAVLSRDSVLTLAGLALSQSNSFYQCIVSNAAGRDTSREARLVVVPPPVAASVTREPADTAVFVTQTAYFSVSAAGSDPLAFAWRRKGDTAVLSTDSVLVISSAALAEDGQVFQCVVSNAYGRDTTREARLQVRPPPATPAIVRQPSDTLVKAGARVAFSAGVLGSAPLSYEWRRVGDTALLSDDSLFVIDPAGESLGGAAFYLVVSNAYGRDTSSEAHLTVRACDSLTLQVAGDTAVEEGRPVALWGKAVCADRAEWSVIAGPAPRLLDPGVDTLAFRAPRVAGDTVIRYGFTAFFGAETRTREVAVRVRESIPDPAFALPAAVPWSGAAPLVLRPAVYNQAQLDLYTGYPVRYLWALEPHGADTSAAGDSLVLRNPAAEGVLEAVLCLDNGGAAACDTARVEVKRDHVSLAGGRRLTGGLLLSGARLTWQGPGEVRIWDWRGRLLYRAEGAARTTREIPEPALRALRGLRARLVFTSR